MSDAKERGSSKLGAMTHEDLAKSINLARSSYKIERWWKYGQPAIDRVTATFNVTNPEEAPGVIGGLFRLQGGNSQIDLRVFPYGIPVLDGVRIDVNINERAG